MTASKELNQYIIIISLTGLLKQNLYAAYSNFLMTLKRVTWYLVGKGSNRDCKSIIYVPAHLHVALCIDWQSILGREWTQD